eukprot:GHUV01028531.1.p1 GENE.GHUV01028531.1~~GHUV01028531.1.p1  ORF type:complete len:119 (-),score=24.08 GHUV01028531.1:470-826(-)
MQVFSTTLSSRSCKRMNRAGGHSIWTMGSRPFRRHTIEKQQQQQQCECAGHQTVTWHTLQHRSPAASAPANNVYGHCDICWGLFSTTHLWLQIWSVSDPYSELKQAAFSVKPIEDHQQ